jgi:hypothetical protein
MQVLQEGTTHRLGSQMMTAWHWLLAALAVPTAAAALYGLHRLGLWLEDRGWLYYRRTKPESSPAAMWVGLQQFIEPGVRHVREVRQVKAEEVWQRLLDYLSDCFNETTVKPEKVRLYLAACQQAGLDWRELYAEAVRRQLYAHPDRAVIVPPPEDVAPSD